MDQLKDLIATMKKQHFWILTGVVVLLSMGVTWTAVGSMNTKFGERKEVLEGLSETMGGLSMDTQHPNEETITSIQDTTDHLEGLVYKAWKELAEDQKAKNRWPEQLGGAFLNFINNPRNADATIPLRDRELYSAFIENHFSDIRKIIEVRTPYRHVRDEYGDPKYDKNDDPILEELDERDRATLMGGGSGSGDVAEIIDDIVWIGKVDWANPEIYRITENWETAPVTPQVRFAQEDLWVYEAILRAIRDTNKDATNHYNSPVKRIDKLEVGQYASLEFLVSKYRVFGADLIFVEETYGEEEEYFEEDEYGEEDSYGGEINAQFGTLDLSGKTPDEQAELVLKHGRYVDPNGEPLSADHEEPFAEFRMMPINMMLFMDQKKIPDLLVDLANSTMPIDIVRVSLWPDQGVITAPIEWGPDAQLAMSDGGGGEYEDGDEGGMEEEGGMDEEGYEEGGGFDMAAMLEDDFNPIYIAVQIQGIIHIFNEPNVDEVGTGAGALDPEEAEADRRESRAAEREEIAAAEPATPSAEGESTDPATPTEPEPAAPAEPEPTEPVEPATTEPAPPTAEAG